MPWRVVAGGGGWSFFYDFSPNGLKGLFFAVEGAIMARISKICKQIESTTRPTRQLSPVPPVADVVTVASKPPHAGVSEPVESVDWPSVVAARMAEGAKGADVLGELPPDLVRDLFDWLQSRADAFGVRVPELSKMVHDVLFSDDPARVGKLYAPTVRTIMRDYRLCSDALEGKSLQQVAARIFAELQ